MESTGASHSHSKSHQQSNVQSVSSVQAKSKDKTSSVKSKWKFLGFGHQHSKREDLKNPGLLDKVLYALNFTREPKTVEHSTNLDKSLVTKTELYETPFTSAGGVYHHNPTPPVQSKKKKNNEETVAEMYEWKSVYNKEFTPKHDQTDSDQTHDGPFEPSVDPRSTTHNHFRDPALVRIIEAEESARVRAALQHQLIRDKRKDDLELKMKRFKTKKT